MTSITARSPGTWTLLFTTTTTSNPPATQTSSITTPKTTLLTTAASLSTLTSASTTRCCRRTTVSRRGLQKRSSPTARPTVDKTSREKRRFKMRRYRRRCVGNSRSIDKKDIEKIRQYQLVGLSVLQSEFLEIFFC